jgi:hypothetical protein
MQRARRTHTRVFRFRLYDFIYLGVLYLQRMAGPLFLALIALIGLLHAPSQSRTLVDIHALTV